MSAFPLPHWGKRAPLAIVLLPLSLLFAVITGLRRLLFRRGLLGSQRLPVPVIIVGNIHVGGVGKTPLTLHLAEVLRRGGFNPGIISRGYGRQGHGLVQVGADSAVDDVGDEPLLLHLGSACPVVVGRDRVAAGRHLLRQCPDVDVVLCDDGLQHYRLQRDIELCVLDGFRGWGNGWLLPAGPLREGRGRLCSVDALIIHGDAALLPGLPPQAACFHMQLQAGSIYRLQDRHTPLAPASLQGRRVLAMAGIGDPQRFFASVQALGITAETRAFPDHHRYCAADLVTEAEVILMTEKDAVKCQALDDGKIHVLPVAACVEPDLGHWLLNHSRLKHGRQTA